MSTDKLANFLREASNWNWDEFAKAEKDPKFTTNESVIFALIRACAMQNLSAIKMSLNRIDGKLKTPLKIEYPKVFGFTRTRRYLTNPKGSQNSRKLQKIHKF